MADDDAIAEVLFQHGLINCEYPHDWSQDDHYRAAVTALARWHESAVTAAVAQDRARIIAGLRREAEDFPGRIFGDHLQDAADLIEGGELDG
jgi:hypothetical protein